MNAVVSEVDREEFAVHLDVFSGPFDVLLGLIAQHRLDITEVALSQVTDEFLAHTRQLSAGGDLERVTQFLLVAATLLDLKASRLLPQAQVEDEEDLAILEARDLLFARLLQYRAYQGVAAVLADRLAAEERRYPAAVPLERRFTTLLPEVELPVGPSQLAELAARALTPPPTPTVSLTHAHDSRVSVAEQAELMGRRLRDATVLSFRTLVADAPDTVTTVARFLGLLELFRDGEVVFDQRMALGELHVRWIGVTPPPEVAADRGECG